jgi:hypothetical protein
MLVDTFLFAVAMLFVAVIGSVVLAGYMTSVETAPLCSAAVFVAAVVLIAANHGKL